ncbi:MAG: hypothetical protein WC073_15800 [Sterolibacterium sp.]
MSNNNILTVGLCSIVLLSGCATTQATKSAATSNAIVIATLDLRNTNGRAVSDNAGGLPSTVVNAAGVPLGPAVGAALDVITGLALNTGNKVAIEAFHPMEIKVIFEEGCGNWSNLNVKLIDGSEALKLKPGSIVHLERDGGSTGNWWKVVQVTDSAVNPIFITKSHNCYPAWVDEWKWHQRGVANRMSWDAHKQVFDFGVKLSEIPEPSFDYIR